jgi:hypothetical protein
LPHCSNRRCRKHIVLEQGNDFWSSSDVKRFFQVLALQITSISLIGPSSITQMLAQTPSMHRLWIEDAENTYFQNNGMTFARDLMKIVLSGFDTLKNFD